MIARSQKYTAVRRGRAAIALLLTLSVARPALGNAQSLNMDKLADSLRVTIEAANNTGDLLAMQNAMALAERALSMNPQSPMLRHYQAYAMYRASNLYLGRGNKDEARKQLTKAREVLESLVKEETIPESHALLSGVYGLQIGVSRVPMVAGMQLGPKSSEWIDRAMKLAPKNPRVLVLKGIGAFNTPASFGGGVEMAETFLKEALVQFETDKPAPPLPAWGRADAHIWLGQAYAKQKKVDAARAQYQAALALQPKNEWITRSLIPALAKIRPE